MFDIQLLKTHLEETFSSDPEIKIEISKETLPNPALTQGTVFSIGHIKVEPLSDIGELLDETEITLGDSESVLFTNIYIICSSEEIHTNWKLLRTALITWTPYGTDKNWGRFTHSGGDMLALQNGRAVWADLWRIKFPAI